jgi:hypothetical protein
MLPPHLLDLGREAELIALLLNLLCALSAPPSLTHGEVHRHGGDQQQYDNWYQHAEESDVAAPRRQHGFGHETGSFPSWVNWRALQWRIWARHAGRRPAR